MDLTFPSHMIWWVSMIDIPVTTSLFWMFWRNKKETDKQVDDLHRLLDTRHSQLRELLAAYKLEVAKTYSTQTDMKELEKRLVAHLLRIEAKLDKQVDRHMKGD